MRQVVEDFVKETGHYNYDELMCWLYDKCWDLGLDILDNKEYQEEIKLLLEIYRNEKVKNK